MRSPLFRSKIANSAYAILRQVACTILPVLSALAQTGVTPGTGPLPVPTARIINFSVRANVGAGESLTGGLVVGGGGRMLVRAAGPSLALFGLTTPMAAPQLELFQAGVRLAFNDSWDPAQSSVFAGVGAFPFLAGSRDATIVRELRGTNVFVVKGAGGGTVLLEAYDIERTVAGRFVNLSARNRVGPGGETLIAGFVVAFPGTFRVLIRGVGPGLSQFGVSGTMSDPRLDVFGPSGKVAENDDWNPSSGSAFTSAGAFTLAAGSRDAAVVLPVRAGAYTVLLSGASVGEALLEIYELPPEGS